MCDLTKELVVVSYMYPDDVVSIGTKHRHTQEQTILLNGRTEVSPCSHRRDWADLMIEFNLYVKKMENGLYESGSHDTECTKTCTDVHPGHALTMMAYDKIVC